jgi:hypothetical protein
MNKRFTTEYPEEGHEPGTKKGKKDLLELALQQGFKRGLVEESRRESAERRNIL